jgi:hypothetical protein
MKSVFWRNGRPVKMNTFAETSLSGVALAAPAPTETEERLFRVWACDNQVYGPIPISILKEWVQDARVLRDSWVYIEDKLEWRQAGRVEELRYSFPEGEETMFLHREAVTAKGIDVNELRLFPIFSGLSNHELAHFIRFAELIEVPQGEIVMRRREPGDAIFFVLTGSMRARIHVGGEEKVLAKIGPGEFFGEMAMLTQTARSADVLADEPCRCLRFTAEAFRSLIEQKPDAAAPMLYSLSTLMAHRVLQLNQRFQVEVASGFVWR